MLESDLLEWSSLAKENAKGGEDVINKEKQKLYRKFFESCSTELPFGDLIDEKDHREKELESLKGKVANYS